jgi:hypothetical protein
MIDDLKFGMGDFVIEGMGGIGRFFCVRGALGTALPYLL